MDRLQFIFSVFLISVYLSICHGEKLIDISPYFTKIIDKHNEVRREVGASNMQYVTWDDHLKLKAERWAQKCRYERPDLKQNTFSRLHGHNLYYSQGTTSSWHRITRTIDRALNSWIREKEYFQYGVDCGSACSYVQMVFAKTNKIGCALSYCQYLRAGKYWIRHATLFVCYYSPRGNLVGEYPYLGGAVCSKCPYGTTCDHGGLCSPPVYAEFRAAAPLMEGGEVVEDKPAKETSLARSGNMYSALDRYGPNRLPSSRSEFDVKLVAGSDCDSYERNNPVRNNPRNYSPRCRTSLTQDEENLILEVTNELRQRKARQPLVWSSEVKEWANYVIRCDREYPGPRTAYTNFGKIPTTRGIENIVYKWGKEGDDPLVSLKYGCRTPHDYKKCNHNTNLMEYKLNRMGCAACNCGYLRQLICIYDNKP